MPFLTSALIGGVVAGAGALGGAAISASAAGNAASQQTAAANYSANLQAQEAQNALQYNQGQYANTLGMEMPWVNTGYGALANLNSLMGLPNTGSTYNPTVPEIPATTGPSGANWPGGAAAPQSQVARNWQANARTPVPANPATQVAPGGTPGVSLSSLVNPSLGAPGSLAQPWDKTFQAPTAATEQNDPGYQFRLQQGQQALERSASASGGLLSGGTAKAEQQYGQNYASNEYSNVYNRAYNEYTTGYNQFQQNKSTLYNMLAGMSGMGQTQASTLGNQGAQSAGQVANIDINAGQGISNTLQTGALRSSGYQTGGANAYANALGGLGGLGSLYALLYGQQPNSAPAGGNPNIGFG